MEKNILHIVCWSLIVLILCSCGTKIATQEPKPSQSEETQITTVPQETENETLEQINDTTAFDPVADYEQWVEEITHPIDGTGMIPLLFVDTKADPSRALLICAGNNGEVYLADRFTYDGASLYTVDGYGRLEDLDRPTTTGILEIGRSLTFIDPKGAIYENSATSLTTTGRIYASFVMAKAQLEKSPAVEQRFYIGSYADADMFPTDVVYEDNCIQADLDGNGVMDCVSWTLTEDRPFRHDAFNYDGYLYSYQLVIELNRAEFTFDPYVEYSKVGAGDYQIFVADVDQDGMFEIVRYMKESLVFDSIAVYDFDGTTYNKSMVYTITPRP